MCCWWRELTEYVGIHLEVTPGKLLSSINVISIKRSCVHEAADPYCLAQVTSLGVSRNEKKLMRCVTLFLKIVCKVQKAL